MLHDKELIDLKILKKVGCEKFAEFIFIESCKLIPEFEDILYSVTVKEHDSNSATYERK